MRPLLNRCAAWAAWMARQVSDRLSAMFFVCPHVGSGRQKKTGAYRPSTRIRDISRLDALLLTGPYLWAVPAVRREVLLRHLGNLGQRDRRSPSRRASRPLPLLLHGHRPIRLLR